MLPLTNTTVRREAVGTAFRRTSDVRLREQYHCILLLLDGHRCPEIVQWLSRADDTSRSWVAAFNEFGLPGLERAPISGRPT